MEGPIVHPENTIRKITGSATISNSKPNEDTDNF